jgi:hypothetical protein
MACYLSSSKPQGTCSLSKHYGKFQGWPHVIRNINRIGSNIFKLNTFVYGNCVL